MNFIVEILATLKDNAIWISALVTAIATGVLVYYNRGQLKLFNKQHSADIFFRAYPHREKTYNELLRNYNTIDRHNFDIWKYDNLRDKGQGEIDDTPLHPDAQGILDSLHQASIYFPEEEETKNIFNLIQKVISDIEEHDKALRTYQRAPNSSPQQNEAKPKCETTHQTLKTDYKDLISKLEAFMNLK